MEDKATRGTDGVPRHGPGRTHRSRRTSLGSKLRKLIGLEDPIPRPESVRIGDRFRSGERCPVSGVYVFDGYVNERTPSPLPLRRDWTVSLRRGERFPAFELIKEDAYWKLERSYAADVRDGQDGPPSRTHVPRSQSHPARQ